MLRKCLPEEEESMEAGEIGFRKPGVELGRPTFQLDEKLLQPFPGFALADHILK